MCFADPSYENADRPHLSRCFVFGPAAGNGRYPGVARRVAQVEQIFREIENMCFLRTGAGMKSVMKTELTVVEAILQASKLAEMFFFSCCFLCLWVSFAEDSRRVLDALKSCRHFD